MLSSAQQRLVWLCAAGGGHTGAGACGEEEPPAGSLAASHPRHVPQASGMPGQPCHLSTRVLGSGVSQGQAGLPGHQSCCPAPPPIGHVNGLYLAIAPAERCPCPNFSYPPPFVPSLLPSSCASRLCSSGPEPTCSTMDGSVHIGSAGEPMGCWWRRLCGDVDQHR